MVTVSDVIKNKLQFEMVNYIGLLSWLNIS